jgi:hypothetical protein
VVAGASRGRPVTYNRFGNYRRYGGSRCGYRAAAGVYAAGAAPGYAYGRSRDGSESDCYYAYRRYLRVTVCQQIRDLRRIGYARINTDQLS